MQAPPYQQPPGQYSPPPKNNAILWIILGVVGVGCCGFIAIGAAVLFPVFSQARLAAQNTLCLSRTKQMALGVIMYSVDNNDLAPPADSWMDKAGTYTKTDDVFHCPIAQTGDKTAFGYAYNKDLGGKNLAKMEDPNKVPVAFDSTLPGRNAASGLETLPNPGRHRRSGGTGNNIAHADGSARFEADAK